MSVSLKPGPIPKKALGPTQRAVEKPRKRPRRITCRLSKIDATFIHHLSIHLAETTRLDAHSFCGSTRADRRNRGPPFPLPAARGSSREGKGESDGAAVGDPGVRGGGGGGGGRAAHGPGAAGRAGADRGAHVLAPAALRRRAPLRRLPAARYLLEERAQADVHIRCLHRRGACALRENHFQSPAECHPLCFSILPLLVHISYLQDQQGY